MSSTVAVLAFAVYTVSSGCHTRPSHMAPRMVSHGEKDTFDLSEASVNIILGPESALTLQSYQTFFLQRNSIAICEVCI